MRVFQKVADKNNKNNIRVVGVTHLISEILDCAAYI